MPLPDTTPTGVRWDILSGVGPEALGLEARVDGSLPQPARECPERVKAFGHSYYTHSDAEWASLVACRRTACQMWIGSEAAGDCGLKR